MKINKEEFFYIKKKLRDCRGPHKIRVVSDSMEPIISKGESLSVSFIELERLKAFDVIVYWQAGVLNCHFFWSVSLTKDGYFVTKSLKYRHDFDLESEKKYLLGIVSQKRASLWTKLKMIL